MQFHVLCKRAVSEPFPAVGSRKSLLLRAPIPISPPCAGWQGEGRAGWFCLFSFTELLSTAFVHTFCVEYTLCVCILQKELFSKRALQSGWKAVSFVTGLWYPWELLPPWHLRSGRAERDVRSAHEHLGEKGFASPAQAACSSHYSSTGGFVPCSQSFMDPSCLNNSFFLYPRNFKSCDYLFLLETTRWHKYN